MIRKVKGRDGFSYQETKPTPNPYPKKLQDWRKDGAFWFFFFFFSDFAFIYLFFLLFLTQILHKFSTSFSSLSPHDFSKSEGGGVFIAKYEEIGG